MNVGKLFGELEATLEVGTPQGGFFTKGDDVKGTLHLNVAKKVQIKKIEMCLRCTEESVVLRKEDLDKLSKGTPIKKNSLQPRAAESKVHWESVQVFIAEGKSDIIPVHETSRGEYTHQFSFNIPENLDLIPGSAIINVADGQEIGIKWTIEAVVHRPGLAPKRKISTIISVLNDGPVLPQHQDKAFFTGSRYVKSYRPGDTSGISGIRKMIAGRNREKALMSFRASYPATILPQIPLRCQLGLTLTSSRPGLIYLHDIRINLIQHCFAQAKNQKADYFKKHEIGCITEHRILYENTIDFTPKLEKWGLNVPFPPNFETNMLKCSYKIEFEMNFKYLNTKKGREIDSIETLSSTIPVVLASLVDSAKVYEDTKEKELVAAQAIPKTPEITMGLDFRSQKGENKFSSSEGKSTQKRKLELSPAAPVEAEISITQSKDGETALLPQVSAKEKVICEVDLNAPLSSILELFVNNSSSWYEKFLTDVEHNTDLSSIPHFQKNDSGKEIRTYEYTKHMNASIGPKSTKCICVDEIESSEPDKSFVVLTTTKTPDVPNGDIFTTFTRLCVARRKDNGTKIRTSSWLEWKGKSWLKSAIEKGAVKGQMEHSLLFVNHLKESNGEKVMESPQQLRISESGSFNIYIIACIISGLLLFLLHLNNYWTPWAK